MSTKATITKSRIEAALRSVDAGTKATVRLRDARVPGLSLTVGRKSSRWSYEYKAPLPGGGWSAGKRLVLGDLSALEPDAAREAATTARAQVASGVDPAIAKRARRAANIEASASQTVAAAIERFSDERSADWTTNTREAFRRDFGVIRAAIGDAPLALVDRRRLVQLIAELLEDQRAAGRIGLRQATRVAGLLSALWRQAGPGSARFAGWDWPGVDAAVADRLPVPGRHRLTSRKRVLSEGEIAALWPALVAPGPLQPHRLVLALSLATGARIGALALIDERDVDLDPVPIVGARDCGATYTIRALEGRKANANARREGAHIVLPLSPQAVALFREALAIRRGAGPHVFEGRGGRQLAPTSITNAWNVLVAAGAAPADATSHDLRRTMRTHLGEIDHDGSFEDEERLLGHAVGGAVSKTYDRGRRLARLRRLADVWGSRLGQITTTPAADVVQLRAQP